MSKLLLREYHELCADGMCLDMLTESERARRASGTVFLTGKLQQANIQNGNGRIYRKDTLQREVENYHKMVNERRALGELDHPDDSVINLKNASHLVTRVWWDGDDVMGTIEVLNTPSGKVLQELINANVKLGISSRGMGSVKQEGSKTLVEDDFQLICFDMVSEPSTPLAFMTPSVVAESLIRETYSKADKINRALNEVLR
tara:strand:- start:535 stop:1140 length:606 start_codon:yes stop_codon:yes gene_type:complete